MGADLEGWGLVGQRARVSANEAQKIVLCFRRGEGNTHIFWTIDTTSL